MSNIGKNVHVYLQTIDAVTDISGARGYPQNLPQNATLPAYVYRRISGLPDRHLQGQSGFAASRLQIDSYGDTPSDANELSQAIFEALTIFPTPTMDSVEVDNVFFENGFDREEPPVDGSDDWRYRVSCDYRIIHTETIPS